MFVELWSRIQWNTSRHLSVFKVLGPPLIYLTQGQKQGGLVCFWRHSQKPQGHEVTELGPEFTWAHCLPAQHFPPEWLCPSEGLRQQRWPNSAVQSGVRTKPIPQGCIIPSGPERMRGWHGVPRPTGSPGNRQGKGGVAEEPAKRTALQKWFHFANSIAKTDGFSSQAGEQIIKSAFPRQSGLKSFILKIHTG